MFRQNCQGGVEWMFRNNRWGSQNTALLSKQHSAFSEELLRLFKNGLSKVYCLQEISGVKLLYWDDHVPRNLSKQHTRNNWDKCIWIQNNKNNKLQKYRKTTLHKQTYLCLHNKHFVLLRSLKVGRTSLYNLVTELMKPLNSSRR